METLLYNHLAIAQAKPVFQVVTYAEWKLSNMQIVDDFMNCWDLHGEMAEHNMRFYMKKWLLEQESGFRREGVL